MSTQRRARQPAGSAGSGGLCALLLLAILAVVGYDAWREHELREARRAALWLELRRGLPDVERAWEDRAVSYAELERYRAIVKRLRDRPKR